MNDTNVSSNNYPQRSLGLALAGVTAFCWSLLALLLKYALTFTDSPTIVWARMFVAFVILLCFLKLKQRNYTGKIFNFKLTTVFAGLFLATNYFGYMKGIEFTSVGNAQVMIQMAPTFLIFIGLFYFKEQLNLRQGLGIGLAICGFYYFYQSQISNLEVTSTQFITGSLWIFLAAITWALFSTLQKLSREESLHHFNLITYGSAAIALSVGVNWIDLIKISLLEFFILVILGANTVIAYGCFGEALKKAPASQVSLIIILNPLLTLALLHLFNVFDFNFITPEVITLSNLVGALLVVFGVGLAVIKKSSPKN